MKKILIALFAMSSSVLAAQDLQAPAGLEDIGTASPYTLEGGFENALDTGLLAAPMNMDPLGIDSTTVDASYSTLDDDPGGPGNPTNDVPVNGGTCVLLAVALGAGYRSYRKGVRYDM
jgi:hypothetical protein